MIRTTRVLHTSLESKETAPQPSQQQVPAQAEVSFPNFIDARSQAQSLHQMRAYITGSPQVQQHDSRVAMLKRSAVTKPAVQMREVVEAYADRKKSPIDNMSTSTPSQMATDSAQNQPILFQFKRTSGRRNKRANWNQKQINQNERLFARRALRQERYAREQLAEKNVPPKTTPISGAPVKVGGHGDGYSQTWHHDGMDIVFSSGHGYRENHHKQGEPPSLNIKELGSMNEIELAILTHLFGVGGIPKLGESGEREISVGAPVTYRFKRFAENKIGVGTYFRPD